MRHDPRKFFAEDDGKHWWDSTGLRRMPLRRGVVLRPWTPAECRASRIRFTCACTAVMAATRTGTRRKGSRSRSLTARPRNFSSTRPGFPVTNLTPRRTAMGGEHALAGPNNGHPGGGQHWHGKALPERPLFDQERTSPDLTRHQTTRRIRPEDVARSSPRAATPRDSKAARLCGNALKLTRWNRQPR
jgi:hypothetical protein